MHAWANWLLRGHLDGGMKNKLPFPSPPPPPHPRQFKMLYSIAWIKICGHVDNKGRCLFCQNNGIKVRIFWTIFVFTWVLVEPEYFFFSMHIYHLVHISYKELKSSVSGSKHHRTARGSVRMEHHATELVGEISLGLLGRNAERHFAGPCAADGCASWRRFPAHCHLSLYYCPWFAHSRGTRTHPRVVPSHTPCSCYSRTPETGGFKCLESCKTRGRSCDSSVE